MREIRVLQVMQSWPQWRTHWHVLHAWPPGAQALVLVFVSLCLVVAASWHVSSQAWQTWWEEDAQVLQWEEELQALHLQATQLRGLKARLTAMPHPSGMATPAWQSWPDQLPLNEPLLLKDWLAWGRVHGLKVNATQTQAEHGQGTWRGTLPQLLAAWHGLPQAVPRMRVTGFDLRVASEDATASLLVLNMQWVSLKDTVPNASLALKTHMQIGPSTSDATRADKLHAAHQPLQSKPAYLHNPFSVQGLKTSLPMVNHGTSDKGWTPLQTRPLSQLRFAGSLSAGDKRQALIALDGLIYNVSPGDRLGQDWGEVIRIQSDHVWLREWFADASGAWLSRERRFPSGEKP